MSVPAELPVLTRRQRVATMVAALLGLLLAVINTGKVKVNGAIITEPGYKVQRADEVFYNGKKLFVTKNQVYILLNKPKDYITTTDDPQGRKTVLQLIKQATDERVYPIGRLDRNTSGILLLTKW